MVIGDRAGGPGLGAAGFGVWFGERGKGQSRAGGSRGIHPFIMTTGKVITPLTPLTFFHDRL